MMARTSGRMGPKRVGPKRVNLIAQNSSLSLTGSVEAAYSPSLGPDAVEVAGCERLGIAITSDCAQLAAEETATLDFSGSPAGPEHLKFGSSTGLRSLLVPLALGRRWDIDCKPWESRRAP